MTMSEGLQNLKKGRPGILDVARKAGVSPATVSRVINGTANVTAETREIVQKTIDELNYSPNKFARSLVTNHSGIIGVLVDRFIRYATANVLVQLEEYASMLGYMSVVLTVDKPFHSQFQQAMTKLRSMSVEGIIVIAPRIGLSQTIVDCQIPEPVIIVSSELKDIGIPMVGEDQYEGASRAVRHLIRLGHRNIWHLAGSMDWFDEQQRLNGWKDTLASNHVHGTRLQASWSPKTAYEVIINAGFNRRNHPDAIFAASDHLAMAAIAALRDLKLNVPKDISIVSYDDVEAAEYVSPALTTVRQNLPEVARRAVSLLVRVMNDRPIDMVTVMQPQFIARGSVRNRTPANRNKPTTIAKE